MLFIVPKTTLASRWPSDLRVKSEWAKLIAAFRHWIQMTHLRLLTLPKKRKIRLWSKWREENFSLDIDNNFLFFSRRQHFVCIRHCVVRWKQQTTRGKLLQRLSEKTEIDRALRVFAASWILLSSISRENIFLWAEKLSWSGAHSDRKSF